jgi:hypothetical protein
MMQLLLRKVTLDVVRVPPKSNPIQFLGVWELSHYQHIYRDEVDEKIVPLQSTYAHLLDVQTLDLRTIAEKATSMNHVQCNVLAHSL